MTTIEVDALGQVERMVEPGNRVTRFDYDEVGRQIEIVTPDEEITAWEYSDAGTLLRRVQPDEGESVYDYDDDQLPISRTDPLQRTWTTTYDGNGRPVTVTDAIANATGPDPAPTLTTSYDALGSVTGLDYTDPNTPDVTFDHDATGRLVSMRDGVGVQTRRYDAAGRVLTIERAGEAFFYGYDAAGSLVSTEYPDGTRVSTTYDRDGRVRTVSAFGERTTYGYDPAGGLTSTAFPNGVREDIDRDALGRLEASTVTRGSTVITFQERDFADDGTVESEIGPAGVTTYDHDERDRLTDVCHGTCPPTAPSVGFAYDEAGNRIERSTEGSVAQTAEFDEADQLDEFTPASAAAVDVTHDGNGNIVDDGIRTYSYDGAGRVVEVRRSPSAGDPDQVLSRNVYDGLGNHVQSVSEWGTTRLTWDEIGPRPRLVGMTGFGPDRRVVWGPDAPLSMRTPTGDLAYLHTDAIGSVTAVTDADGQEALQLAYDPFGSLRWTSGSGGLETLVSMMFGFAGQRYDWPTGLYEMGARWYDTAWGRFTQPDPAGPIPGAGHESTYLYAGGSPLTMVDPTGLRLERAERDRAWLAAHQASVDPLTALTEAFSDPHVLFDAVGLVPVVGEVADITNALLYATEGNWTDAAISALAVIPVVGSAGTSSRLFRYSDEAADAARAVTRHGDDLAEAAATTARLPRRFDAATTRATHNWNVLTATPELGSIGGASRAGGAVGNVPLAPSTRGTPRAGLGVNDPPARLQGPWTDADLRRSLTGRPPRSLGSPELHHADQMPGAGIHEVDPGPHRAPGVHPSPWNQGVTDAMRASDRQLHWWYRAQEQGAWERLGPGAIYDNWPG